MKSVVAASLAVLLSATPTLAQQKPPVRIAYPTGVLAQSLGVPAENVSATIQQLSKQWFDAFLVGDGATMDRLEAPGFMLTDGPNFMQKTKPRAATMKARKADRTWTMDDVRVNVAGDTAILTSHHVWKMNDGSTEEVRVTEVWRRDGGQWRILAGHSSEVPLKK